MEMTQSTVSHAQLVEIHRHRFAEHAHYVQLEVREFKKQDDCGNCWHRVDYKFVERIKLRLPEAMQTDKGFGLLCASVLTNTPTPELDELISAYVTALTGMPAPKSVSPDSTVP